MGAGCEPPSTPGTHPDGKLLQSDKYVSHRMLPINCDGSLRPGAICEYVFMCDVCQNVTLSDAYAPITVRPRVRAIRA